jgi:hypothetical protein
MRRKKDILAEKKHSTSLLVIKKEKWLEITNSLSTIIIEKQENVGRNQFSASLFF